MKEVWFDPLFGASGDMVLGALLGLGVDVAELNSMLGTLGIDGLEISHSPTQRAGISATKAHVTVPEGDHAHRPWTEIDRLIHDSELPEMVRRQAQGTFRTLGEAEARVHRTTIDEVQFHEVGAYDAIADVVGSWIAWHLLGEPDVCVSTFGLGAGSIQSAHGRLPLPAPAVLELLTGWGMRPLDVQTETVTPTGAAILTSMALSKGLFPPAGTIIGVGRGAGSRDVEIHPNVLTAIFVDTGDRTQARRTMMELVTNVDDATPEVLAYVVERCLAEGANDAWIAPIVMKKGRPAHTVNVLCDHDQADALRAIIMAETGSLGVRQRPVERFSLQRTFETVTVRRHEIRIKIGPHRAKPELSDCIMAASILRLPLQEVQRLAMEQFQTG